jgi:hypothetical protein
MASDCSATLEDLSVAINTLSSALSPLLQSSLAELVENGIAPLEKAKLEVTMAYVVHDLVWSEFELRPALPYSPRWHERTVSIFFQI